MEAKIPELLKLIEKQNKITILFAVEAGSRAWELNSQESDYDVHFVYYRTLEEYISVNKLSEEISAGFDKDFNQVKREGAFIEMNGFDIFKYFKLLSSSNVATIEWINSDIVYIANNYGELKSYFESNFNKSKAFLRLYNMSKGSYKSFTMKKDLNIKKYLHCIRLLLGAQYVLNYKKLPNTSMIKNLEELEKDIPTEVFKKIKELVELKINGHGKDVVKDIPVIDNYFKEKYDEFEKLGYNKKKMDDKDVDVNFLNDFLRKLIIKK